MRGRVSGLVVTFLLLAGCTAAGPTSQDERHVQGAADLALLLDRLEVIHPEPFHGVPRDVWVSELRSLQQQLPELTSDETVVEVMRLVALLSREGRDGHQFALPQPGHDGPVLPLRLYELAGGLVVTAAMPPYEALVGSRVTAIAGTPVAEVLAAVEPLVPRDGPATVRTFRPQFVLRTQVLAGLGIVAGVGPVQVAVARGGTVTQHELDPVPFSSHEEWAGRFGLFRLPEHPGSSYRDYGRIVRTTRLGPAYVVRLTEIQAHPGPRLARRLRAPGVRRVVLDLRQNPGGDNTHNGSWVELLEELAADRPGTRLVVLTDRVTFSAASNLATDLERALDPVFVGEAMGGGLNFWDDVTQVHLDDLPVPMQVGVSTRYWQRAAAGDPRLTIRPDLPVPVTATDVIAGRDPALRAALGPLP